MRWFRRLTCCTYAGKRIAGVLGGATAASEASAEAGWLARGYRAVRDFTKRHYRVALGAAAGVGAMAAAERADAGTIVDIDWRLAGDYSNVNYLADKTSLDPLVSGSTIHIEPLGTIKFKDGTSVPTGYRLWFIDEGGQPVGVRDISSPGTYAFIYTSISGDMTSGVDEGASPYDKLQVVCQQLTNNSFRSGDIVSGYLKDIGFVVDPDLDPENNIEVGGVIPEPASMALLGLGAGLAALTPRRHKFQPEMDSDLGKPDNP